MGTQNQKGLSPLKLLLIIALVFFVIGGAILGYYVFNKQTQTASATTFITSFVDSVETDSAEATFESMDAGDEDIDAAYYAWLFWSTPIKEGAVKIDKVTQSSVYKNSSALGSSADAAVITFYYDTDQDSRIYFTTSREGGEWKVSGYGTTD